jgi:hypothetical protein
MGSLLPSNTFGGRGLELFQPVGGIEPEIDVVIQGNLTVLGQEVSLPDGNLVLGLGNVTAHSATLATQVSCANLTATDLIQGVRGTFTGELIAGSLNLDGPLELTNLTADSIVSAGPITGGSLAVGGNLTAGDSTLAGNLVVNGQLGATVNGPLSATGLVSFPGAALTVASLVASGALSAASGVISGNLTVNGTLNVPGGIDAPPVVAGLNCSSIRFGNLLAIFGSGSTGGDGQVTYITRPFTSLFTLVLTGNLNGGSTLLFNSNGANGPQGQLYAVATFSNGQRVGAGIAINMVAFAIAA